VTDSTTTERGSRGTTRAVLIAAIGSALSVVPVWLIGGLAVEITTELDLSEPEFGIVAGSFMAASAALALVGGRIVQRHGWVRGLRWGATATAVACLGVALTVGPWQWLIGFIGLAGASYTLAQPSANVLLIERVPPSRQGLAFGVKQSSIPMGTLAAGVAVPVVGATLGWRWAFIAVTVGCLLLLFALRGSARSPHGEVTSHAAAQPATEPKATIAPDLRRPLLVLSLAGGLGTAASNCLGAFTVLYGASLGIDSRTGGLILAVGSIANILTRVTLGSIVDRRATDHLRWVAVMMLLGTAAFVAMAIASTPTTLVLAVVAAFATGWGWNGLYHLGLMRRYRSSSATATGIIGLFLSIGGALGPMVVGIVVGSYSYTAAWLVAGAMTTIAGGLVLLGARLHAGALARRTVTHGAPLI
jgi:MFS family permease